MSAQLTVAGEFDDITDLLRSGEGRRALESQLPGYLREQRWFGGRAREITSAQIRGWAELGGDVVACISIVVVEDSTGRKTEHQLHFALQGGHVIDALQLGEVRRRMVDLLGANTTIEGENLSLVVEARGTNPCGDGEGKVLSADQSNTSLVFNDACLVKLYRRLERGPNPDVELSCYLGETEHFSGVPPFFATLTAEYDGSRADLAALQGWVPSEGDAWGWAMKACQFAMTEGAPAGESRQAARELAGRLGRTTAQLHTALAKATGPGLAPEELGPDDRDDWLATIAEELDALRSSGSLDPALAATLERVSALKLELPDDCGLKIRVHGDYHLGQVLKRGNDFVVLDFEGEPSRPIRERRALQSPLVDVAGMLRSWDYVARTCQHDASDADARARAREWGIAVRGQFLDSYWQEAERAERQFLPATARAREQLLRLFELRKALYEVRYELNNRPDWVELPAAAVASIVEGWE